MLAQHPLVDRVGKAWVESHTDASLIGLTQGRAHLLAQGVPVVFVAQPGAHISFALLARLRLTGSDWVIEQSDGRLWSPTRGFACGSPGDVFRAGLASVPDTERSRSRAAVQLTVSVHHRAATETRLGGCVEELALALTGAPPTSWGSSEPTTLRFDRAALTFAARSVAPRSSRFIVHGSEFAALIHVFRTSSGITEETRFLWSPLVDLSAVSQSLRRVATVQRVAFASAFAAIASENATIPPEFAPPPSPVAMVLGPHLARQLQVDAATLNSIVPVEMVGARGARSFVLAFEGERAAAWTALQRTGLAIGAHAIDGVISTEGQRRAS